MIARHHTWICGSGGFQAECYGGANISPVQPDGIQPDNCARPTSRVRGTFLESAGRFCCTAPAPSEPTQHLRFSATVISLLHLAAALQHPDPVHVDSVCRKSTETFSPPQCYESVFCSPQPLASEPEVVQNNTLGIQGQDFSVLPPGPRSSFASTSPLEEVYNRDMPMPRRHARQDGGPCRLASSELVGSWSRTPL